MKRLLGRSLLMIGLLGVLSVALLLTLMAFGVIGIGISPLYSYRLTDEEAKTLDAAHKELHTRMANEEYDLIAENLVEARVSKEENLGRIKEAFRSFGAPTEFEFFRAAEPYLPRNIIRNSTERITQRTTLQRRKVRSSPNPLIGS